MKRQNLLYIGVFIAAISISAVATQLVGDFGRFNLPKFNFSLKKERGHKRGHKDFRSEAARNIDRLLADDQSCGREFQSRVRNGESREIALRDLVQKMRAIDTTGVPSEIVELYKLHTDEWENSGSKKTDGKTASDLINSSFYALERRAKYFGAGTGRY